MRTDLLEVLAGRVRSRRAQLGWTRATLAERSGLSLRFLAKIEGGEGNVSLLRLAGLADALGTTPEDLIRRPEAKAPIVALVGMRTPEEVERNVAALNDTASRVDISELHSKYV